MATINNTTPQRPQSPLSLEDQIAMERVKLLETYKHIGPCGRFTQFFVRNLALFLLLAVGLVGLLALFHPQLLALTQERCWVHHDEHFGKMWVECQEPLRRAFGPRRPY